MTTTAGSIETLQALSVQSPRDVDCRIALAWALLDARRAAEAYGVAEQALALAPGHPEATAAQSAVHAALQAGDPNLVRLELAAVLDPEDGGAQLMLGEAYAALDRPHDAERHLKRALDLGHARAAHADLGALYLSVGMADAAEHHARASLADVDQGAGDDTAAAMAHQTLAAISEAKGDQAAAARHLDQAYARQSLFRQPVVGAAFTTLVLATRDTGNISYQSLMPQDRFDRAVWYMEHARLDQIPDLPPYAVVLNAIGDPDVAIASAEIVDAFLARQPRPVLNDPARVRATFRHRIAETLAGVDDVVAPTTLRVSAEIIAAGGLVDAVAAAGLAPPVIVRPVGSHGGVGLLLAGDGAALDAATVEPGLDAYVSAFHDYRSPDGFYRKYRMIFVDRRAFPYHMAIGRHWMVHHHTTDMADDKGRIDEEMRFLRDPEAVIGARALAAVEAIGQRLDLDYAGVDFSVTADGQVLVFETNATMLTHLESEASPFVAKNPFIQPILDAFQARLTILAGV